MRTIYLTLDEARIYDSGDDSIAGPWYAAATREWQALADREDTTIEIRHPDGFVVASIAGYLYSYGRML